MKGSESIRVVNTIANNVFKYKIILNNKTILFIIVLISYIFNLLGDLWYNKIEFKELFINSKVLTQLTEGIDSLKELQ